MDNKLDELIKCPFCKEQTVFAKVATTYRFLSDHRVKRSGIDFEGDSMGELIGEISHEPIISVHSYHCTSCGKQWFSNELRLEEGSNGEYCFVPFDIEKVTKRGRKQ